jgi:hypothetical protein
VIERQVRALGDDVVFGVTRLAEAARVRLHRQTRLIWRVHLRLTAALSDYDEERLRYLQTVTAREENDESDLLPRVRLS